MTTYPTQAARPADLQLQRIEKAQLHLEQLLERHKQELQAARVELAAAAIGLATIEDAATRLQAVEYAYHHSKAPKAELAFAIFGRAKGAQYRLRKLLAGPYRTCQRCGETAACGSRFASREFFCDQCSGLVHAERERARHEREKAAQRGHAIRQQRITELRSRQRLSEAEANELAALIVREHDGPVDQLWNFLQAATRDSNAA